MNDLILVYQIFKLIWAEVFIIIFHECSTKTFLFYQTHNSLKFYLFQNPYTTKIIFQQNEPMAQFRKLGVG
ncbi:hypothetical protein TPSD3_05250 [Thioflexithrix psekupsensis]|uniref:Uncharacterized protein n=1 Tax=Thioflexithrix psekupsensis TaxID=1570016 RepID=A0A251X752_9GAMM|nr:hypothetical protein TPSD3_05250 [Thioflexithrix psekupsensis]